MTWPASLAANLILSIVVAVIGATLLILGTVLGGDQAPRLFEAGLLALGTGLGWGGGTMTARRGD